MNFDRPLRSAVENSKFLTVAFMVDLRITETRQIGAVRKTKLPFYHLVGAVSNCAYAGRGKPHLPRGESVYLFLEFTIV